MLCYYPSDLNFFLKFLFLIHMKTAFVGENDILRLAFCISSWIEYPATNAHYILDRSKLYQIKN